MWKDIRFNAILLDCATLDYEHIPLDLKTLAEKDKVESFIENVGKSYREKIGYDAPFYVAEIADGIIDEKNK